jgi:hypothetical protein
MSTMTCIASAAASEILIIFDMRDAPNLIFRYYYT